MNTRPKLFWWLILSLAIMALSFFAGCRAFEPEAVIVNRAPETFLIGAPLEGGGGYYHYHMFWYGSDEDGVVDRFVWALTDTSVQNEDTSDDEEDSRFNPALDIDHLTIGHWTSKTDSIFDFQINQGTSPSVDMTFHMVAMDDRGDFDRTPARLHFFSNTLGTPQISFFRIDGNDTIALASGVADTVGFGQSYQLHWKGSTPNVLGYDPVALAQVDTVAPRDDGLFGYKWRLMGDIGGECGPFDDCWHPRRFNEATGDSFSYYAEINSLLFRNDDSSSDPFGKELDSGSIHLRINSIDVAGVEVGTVSRNFEFVVNRDPETILLNGETDWDHPEDTEVYPYYIQLNDPTHTHVPFVAGDRIPDRSYVVFKALAKDHDDDLLLDPDFQMGMTGVVDGLRTNYTGNPFSFSSGAGAIDYDPTWDAGLTGWYADTLGFLVGPSTEFTFKMQAVDEHERRDGTPAELSFHVGYPPCLQCVELLPNLGEDGSAYDETLACYYHDVSGHPCFADTTKFYVVKSGTPYDPDQITALTPTEGIAYLSISKGPSRATSIVDSPDNVENYYYFQVNRYSMTMLMHGKDDEREAWINTVNIPESRMGALRYQVDYDCDPANTILDGGGTDDIYDPTWGEPSSAEGIEISQSDGLWKIRVDFYLPQDLANNGAVTFSYMMGAQTGEYGPDSALNQELINISLRQMSSGSVQAIAIDQAKCHLSPTRPAKYHMFDNIRPPGGLNSGTWRDCDNSSYVDISLSMGLSSGAMDSSLFDGDGNLAPATQHFEVIFLNGVGDEMQCADSQ